MEVMRSQILVIEDDLAIQTGLRDALQAEGYSVVVEADGKRGLHEALHGNAACIILDLMLPSMNGRDVCQALRKSNCRTPILMLTSKSEESDIIVGLELGADDYMSKPFSLAELLARIRALIRRRTGDKIEKEVAEVTFGQVHVDFVRQEALIKGVPVRLSVREFCLLRYLVQHDGRVVTREMILDDVWGYDAFPTTRTIDNYILSLRKKLEENPTNPLHIVTIHTLGYKFISNPT